MPRAEDLAPGERLCNCCDGHGMVGGLLPNGGGYDAEECACCEGRGLKESAAVVLRGDRNQCAGCGELFNSSFAFDKHRAGEHADNGRYCLKPDAMRAKGMSKNAAGFWITAAMPQKALP